MIDLPHLRSCKTEGHPNPCCVTLFRGIVASVAHLPTVGHAEKLGVQKDWSAAMSHRMTWLATCNHSHVALPGRHPRPCEDGSVLLPPAQGGWKGSHCWVLRTTKSYGWIFEVKSSLTSLQERITIALRCFPWSASPYPCESLEDACKNADKTCRINHAWAMSTPPSATPIGFLKAKQQHLFSAPLL